MTMTLLDGGMGVELRRRGVSVPDYKSSIWSAMALISDPLTVRQVHEDYLAAGADIITANTYAVTPVLLAREGLAHRTEELARTGCRLAVEARDRAGTVGRVAGSLAPLDTSYRGDLVRPFDELVPIYDRLAGAMADMADLFICETMSRPHEGRAAALAACRTGKPVWVARTMGDEDGRLRGGETLEEAIAAIADLEVEAVLINCCPTDSVDRGLDILRRAAGRRFGAYANDVRRAASQEDLDKNRYAPLTPDDYADCAAAWVERGAEIVGGCCGTGPEHVAAMARRLKPVDWSA